MAGQKERKVPDKQFRFPSGYGDNKIVLLVRDPWWIFAYWEIRREKEDETVKNIRADNDDPEKSILRVYDITDVNFDGNNARSYFDIELKDLANNWYINVGSPDRSWVVDIGIVTKKRNFYLLARSNPVRTPSHNMSEKSDTEWMTPDDSYWKMFGLSGGLGIGKDSLKARESFRKRLGEQMGSSQISNSASFCRKPLFP